MLSKFAAIIADCARSGARSRTDAAAVDKSNSMTTNATREGNTSARDREEPGHGIKLFGHDVSDDSEGELVAIYSPAGGAMDGQIAYARPRDFVDLETNR